MNRLVLITMLVLIVPVVLLSQINWTEHTIDSTFNGASSVYAIDLDNDGDVDVLGTANMADDITWWENDGSNPPSFTEHTIDSTFDGAWSVYAIDLDNDEDVDVLGAAAYADEIIWWENDGSNPPVFTEHTIDSTFNYSIFVYAIDLDDDGDVDVLGASGIDDGIIWWENDGSNPPSFTEHTIDSIFDYAQSVYAIDLDDDNNVDVLGAASGTEIAWWKNDGSENFTKDTIADDFYRAGCVYAINLDDDEDVDVLGASRVDDGITWWENDGSNPPSFTEHNIASDFDYAYSVYAIDLDNDGDVDVLGTAKNISDADDITWWENDGASPPGFTKHTIDSTFDNASSVYAIDLDNDGDVDVLGAAHDADDITWWESDLAKAHDVGTVSIDIPSTVPEDTTLNPHATVKNFGENTETFSITCTIEPSNPPYISTTVSNIVSGDSIQVTFPDAFTFETGSYTVTVYTKLIDDENPANDTLEKVIETFDPGINEYGLVIPTSFSFGLKNNPAKGKAVFSLALPEASAVTLRIYDVTGRLIDKVISGKHAAGYHTITWNPEVTAGVYFYSLESPWKTEVGKLVLIR